MALGFYRPHIAMYVPQRFYDLYPIQSIRVPDYREQLDDITGLPEFALRYLVNMDWTAYGATMPSGEMSSDHYLLTAMPTVAGRDGHAQAIQAYLASISFIDECLGQVIPTLIDLTGGSVHGYAQHQLDGRSLKPLIYNPLAGATLSEELYDHDADPGETRNLLYWEPDRYEPVRAQLAALLDSRVR
jgi:hypothetical protein